MRNKVGWEDCELCILASDRGEVIHVLLPFNFAAILD
jgi:hypothetical protein